MPKLSVSALFPPPSPPSNGVGGGEKAEIEMRLQRLQIFSVKMQMAIFSMPKVASIFVCALDTWWFRGENVGKSGDYHDESNQIRASKS